MMKKAGSCRSTGTGTVRLPLLASTVSNLANNELHTGVTNAGMIIGSLAVYHEDPTGIAAKLLPLAVAGARKYCGRAVESDGTWPETPDYWYAGGCLKKVEG